MLSGLIQSSLNLGVICNNLRVTTAGSMRILSLVHTGCPTLRDVKKGPKGKKTGFWPWSRSNEDEGKLKIIKPEICCKGMGKTILDPECKVAIVVGGAAGIGLGAADSLLYYGARAVVLADEDPLVGEKAAQNLCDFYGKNRARFLRCDPKSSCQLEGVFEESMCRYKRVDVLFSYLDRSNNEVWPRHNSQKTKGEWSNTMRVIHTGIKYMGMKNNTEGAPAGIIVNCATIIGFMDWPGNPTPVYCFKEPVAETTMDLAKTYPVETTGVRIVALLQSHKPFEEIALPDFPESNAKNDYNVIPYCEPPEESRIGKALVHVMSQAPTGSTWLAEPAPCMREIPWQIYFPIRQGETVDPQIYDKKRYTTDLNSQCVVAQTGNCPVNCQRIKCK